MSLLDFYRDHSHPLIQPLLEMSWRGVRVDLEARKQAILEYETQEETLRGQLNTQVGRVIDPLSPKQLMDYVYGELKIPAVQKTRIQVGGEKGKTPSLDEISILELLTHHELPALRTVLEIRKIRKILGTYLKAPLDNDGRLRCSYDITGTETGRLSSKETPFGTGTNLQNVPPGIARRLVIPDEGMVFVGADYSQAEARLVAYCSGETRLIAVFESGGDIHRRNAATIFKKPEGAVTPVERSLAKRVVHASNYGVGPVKFAQVTGLHRKEAKELLNRYFLNFPRIKLWHTEIGETIRKTRVLTTPLGRIRQFLGTWSDDLLREAYAFIPQSTVSDLLNDSLIEFWRRQVAQPMLQVHDSFIVQCPPDRLESVQQSLRECMNRPIAVRGRSCAIPIEIKVGPNWDTLH